MGKSNEIIGDAVELSYGDGVAFIEQSSPLTRLHYFDGKFLRADALALEQDYHRTRTRLANIAGGWGVVHGLGVSLAGAELAVTAGLAITPAGNFVLASSAFQAPLADLLGSAAPAPLAGSAELKDCPEKAAPGVKETAALAIYEITVGPIEGLCGNEPVYGKLCETACASDSRHPYWREGVVLRLRPVTLNLATSAAVPAAAIHLRSRIASAYFAAEPWLTKSLLSSAGLAGGVWCQPATAYGRDEVVIGLLAREGGVNRVIDAWGGRRERMDSQPRGYWQGRMAMRPWNVFVAQILQFQCQLSGLFQAGSTTILPADDCDRVRELLTKTRIELEALVKRYADSSQKILAKAEGRPTTRELRGAGNDIALSYADLSNLSARLAAVETGKGALPKTRMLLAAGFFELPPAGYLPVDTGAAVEDQAQRMFGDGVKLHYHAVRHDEIAHLLEEAQHLERISLTRGLDNPAQAEQVEIFVPDGEVRGVDAVATGTWWRIEMLEAAVRALIKVAQPVKAAPAPTPAPVPAPSPRSAAAKRAAARDTALGNVEKTRTEGDIIRRQDTIPPLDGLVRTEGRDDGSQGFTLVVDADVTAQADAATGKLNYVRRYTLEGGSSFTHLGEVSRIGLYMAGDIARDPFSLPVGGTAALTAEMASMIGTIAGTLEITGTLTVLAQRTLPAGSEERLVQLSLQMVDSTADPQDANTSARVRLLLTHDGDHLSGAFLIDDEKQDPASGPVLFEWDDAPRRAAMFVLATDAAAAIENKLTLMRGMAPREVYTVVGATALDTLQTATQRQQLMSMTGLAEMPSPTSTVGAAALDTLVRLSDAIDDAAFLLRARQRLLPTLDQPKLQTIRAVDDWLMFRRARTHLCGPVCANVAPLALEMFRVWHLRLDNEEQLALVAAALDKGDEKALAALPFRTVGMLRYRDESAFSEETADSVLEMWAAAKPGPRVGLGRVWETAPTTGQGWQNHFRLRNMLQQIATLTKPPARGDGALAAIPTPARVLADGSVDGGMLVVTLAALAQRNALLIYGNYDSDAHYLQKDAPQSKLQFADDQPQGTVLASFIAGLTPNQPVLGVTLATTKAAPDAGAGDRLAAVVQALVAASRPAPAAGRQKKVSLSQHDRDELLREVGIDANDYDDIIFFELNAGD